MRLKWKKKNEEKNILYYIIYIYIYIHSKAFKITRHAWLLFNIHFSTPSIKLNILGRDVMKRYFLARSSFIYHWKQEQLFHHNKVALK